MKQFSVGWSLIRIYTFLVYLFLFAPIVVVMVLAFNPKQFGIFPMEGFSFRWFIKLAQNEAIIAAFKNSLVLGSLTAVLSTAIGILAAMAFIRFDFPGKNTINTLLLSPIMIPEVVLGVALLLFLRWLQQPKSFALLLLGPYILTERLRPLLAASDDGRVVNITSGGMYTQKIDVDDLQSQRGEYSGAEAYARAKRGLMILTEEWAERWSDIAVNAMHPGWADTPGVETALPGFYRLTKPLLRTPEEGADTVVWLAAATEAGDVSGKFWLDREQHPSHLSDRTRESGAERHQLLETLMALHPWRKGPFELFGIHIDTEWRSDWKWERIKPHIRPLKDRSVLDIGCGNGAQTLQLAKRLNGDILAVDNHPPFLDELQRRAKTAGLAASSQDAGRDSAGLGPGRSPRRERRRSDVDQQPDLRRYPGLTQRRSRGLSCR